MKNTLGLISFSVRSLDTVEVGVAKAEIGPGTEYHVVAGPVQVTAFGK